jgi:flagellin-like hook-associated protein FlgL
MRRIPAAVYCMAVFVCLLSMSVAPRGAVAADPASGWGEAVMLEYLNPPIMGDANDPHVAADVHGNAFAVWDQPDGSRDCVFANRYVRGEGWTGAVLIDTMDVYDCSNPWVAVDGSGNAFAVWQQFDMTESSIWANIYSVDTGWGTPELIEGQAEEAGMPQVVADRWGNATVVWRQFLSGTSHLWSCRYVAGEGWGTEEEIEGYADWSYLFDAAVDDSGCVVAVWSQWDGLHLNLSANRYVPGEGWGAAQMIGGNASGDVSEPKVAVDPSGNAMAVWCQWDGVFSSWYCRYVVGEGWGAAALLESEEVYDALFPRTAGGPSGEFLTVWQQPDGGVDSIWWSRYVPGEGWSTPGTVETNAFFAMQPQVVLDRYGNGTAIWHQSNGVYGTICSSRYVPGEGWGEMELASTNETGGTGYISSAADGIGNVVAVWLQYDGYRYNVWANTHLNPDTTPPVVSIESPSDGLTLEVPTIEVSGTTEPGVELEVNGVLVSVAVDGSFSCVVSLLEGENSVTANATDLSGNWATDTVTVTYINPVYALQEELSDALAEVDSLQAELDSAFDSLADLQAQLNDANADIVSLEEQLAAAEAALEAAQDALDAANAELADLESQLSDSEADVASLQVQLYMAQANLTVAQGQLAAAEDDLADVEEQLASAEEDLDDERSTGTLLMAALVAAAAVAAVMTAMYVMLRRKAGDRQG